MPDMHSAMCSESVNIEQVDVATAPQMIFETQAAKARGVSDRWIKDLAAEDGLNKTAAREQEDREAIGGLRTPHKSVKRLPGVDQYRQWLWPILRKALPDDKVLKQAMLTLGVTDTPAELRDAALKLRSELGRELHTEVLKNEGLQGPLVHGLAVLLQDPDEPARKWLLEGAAPLGIEMPI